MKLRLVLAAAAAFFAVLGGAAPAVAAVADPADVPVETTCYRNSCRL